MTPDGPTTTAMQQPFPAECARRVRLAWANNGEIHVIIEEEERSGDRLFEDERARVTVPWGDLMDAVTGIVKVVP